MIELLDHIANELQEFFALSANDDGIGDRIDTEAQFPREIVIHSSIGDRILRAVLGLFAPSCLPRVLLVSGQSFVVRAQQIAKRILDGIRDVLGFGIFDFDGFGETQILLVLLLGLVPKIDESLDCFELRVGCSANAQRVGIRIGTEPFPL